MALYTDKKDFIDAIRQINDEFRRINDAVTKLEEAVAELKKPARTTATKKVEEKA